jgi:hypothetical protein
MYGVRKRIAGGRGETRLGSLPGLPFVVRGMALHYERPFRGFVDLLEPAGDRIRGRATFRGRELGRFEMSRCETRLN